MDTIFTVAQIARLEGVSPKVARRRMRDAVAANQTLPPRLSNTRWVFANTNSSWDNVADVAVGVA
jgi:hypothetical protein